jgi:hypothetical protein
MTQHLLEHTGAKWLMTGIGDVRELGTDLDYKVEYGEASIFTTLKDKLLGPPKPLGYKVSPGLEVYNKSIWEDHEDKWLTPIYPYLAKSYKDGFFKFPDGKGEDFLDEHFKTSQQILWLTEVLLPKLGITPNTELYNDVAARVDEIFYNIPAATRYKTEFEIRLFKERFKLPKWPNMIRGFYYFKDEFQE